MSWPGNPRKHCRIYTEARHRETEKHHENFMQPEQLCNDLLSTDPRGLLHRADFPSGLHFSGVILQLLAEFVSSALPADAAPGDLLAATSAPPRAESHQPPPHSPVWRGEPWSFSTLSTPSALHKGGRAAASGHRGRCMATTRATAPPPQPAAPPNLLDVMFLQKPCTLPRCRQQITTVL